MEHKALTRTALALSLLIRQTNSSSAGRVAAAQRTGAAAMSTPPPIATAVVGRVRADQVMVRRTNLALVLRHLRDAGPRSRARVAAETGLNKATVSSLVAELVERGLLAEGQLDRAGAVGRPGQIVEVDGRSVAGVGLELNVDYVA